MRHPWLYLVLIVAACHSSQPADTGGAQGGPDGSTNPSGTPPPGTPPGTPPSPGGDGGVIASAAYPLSISGRGLVDKNGKPFPLVADAAWSLFVGTTETEATTYLEDRRTKGFTTVLVNLVEHKFDVNGAPKNKAGDAPFTTAGDFSTPNDAYFAYVDKVMNIALAKNILVLLAPAYIGYNGADEGWYQSMLTSGTTKLTTYGTYVGKRYAKYPNVIWVDGGDFNPPNRTVVTAVEAAIKAADPSHMHTAHCNRGTSSMDYWPHATYTWLDLDAVYTDANVYAGGQTAYTRSGALPFFSIESIYEGEGASPSQVRSQAYGAIMSGGFGHVYGHGDIWGFGVHLDLSPANWPGALDSPGAKSMSQLAKLLNTYAWSKLVPDFANALFTGAASHGAWSSIAADKKLAMIYAPTSQTYSIDLSKLAGPTNITWFDPTNGATSAEPGGPFTGNKSLAAKGNNAGGDPDWVIVLESP
jgi:hypothetical protein